MNECSICSGRCYVSALHTVFNTSDPVRYHTAGDAP